MEQVDHGGVQFGGVEDVFEKGQADANVGEGGRGGGRASRVAQLNLGRHGRLEFQRGDKLFRTR